MWLCLIVATGLEKPNITTKRKVDEKGNRNFSENVIEGAYSETLLRQQLWIGIASKRNDGGGKGKVASLRAMTDGQIV